MLIAFVLTSITGISIFIQLYLPHMIGLKRGSTTSVDVCHLETILHIVFSFIFLALVLIHLILHKYWFKNLPKYLKK